VLPKHRLPEMRPKTPVPGKGQSQVAVLFLKMSTSFNLSLLFPEAAEYGQSCSVPGLGFAAFT
jgi:hypothetical protein